MTNQQVNNLSTKSLYEFILKGTDTFVGVLEHFRMSGADTEYYLIKASDLKTLGEATVAKDQETLGKIRIAVKLADITGYRVIAQRPA
jgi:hypothetical protein